MFYKFFFWFSNLQEEKEKELQNPQKTQNVDFFKVPAPSRMKPVSTIGTSSSVASVPKPTSAQMRGLARISSSTIFVSRATI